MASWCREGRVRRLRSPARPCGGREFAECVQVWAPPPPSPRLLERLLRDMQSHVDEMQTMRAALLDATAAPAPRRPEAAAAEASAGGYGFSVDVAGFAPEEVSVQVAGRRLRVCAKRDKRSEAADGCVAQEYREVRKEVLLPDDADLQAIACALDPAGLLSVSAPRRPPPDPQPRDIPIAVAGRTTPERPRKASVSPEQEKKEPPAAQP